MTGQTTTGGPLADTEPDQHRLGQGKGRGGIAWWLVCLLIGPIATLLIVVLPRVGQGAGTSG